MKKALTLIELVLAVALLAVIVLAATSIDVAARYFFKSSDTKSRVLNEASLIVEHIQKRASQSSGFIDNPGIRPAVPFADSSFLEIRLDGDSPLTFDDASDRWVRYDFNGNNLVFTDGSNAEIISSKVTHCAFSSASSGAAVDMEITVQYIPNEPMDPKENPQVTLRTSVLFGEHSFR